MNTSRPTRMVTLSVLALAVPLFLCIACAKTPPPIAYETLAQGMTSSRIYEKPRFEVIESGSRLAQIHGELFAGRLPAPETPAVDFSRHLVLFIAMEQKPSAGYRVEFSPPRLTDDLLVLEVEFLEPAAGRAVATVMTQPFLLLKVSRPPDLAAVRFVDPAGAVLAQVNL